jgi:hypothetical protein
MTTNYSDDTIERVAEAVHIAWADWVIWMFEKWNETHSSGETFQERWARQARTPYASLNEAEKESDRIEARRYLRSARGTFA